MAPVDYDNFIKECVEHPKLKGQSTIVTLTAIAAAESGLDNLALGQNSLPNRTPVGSFIKVGGEILIDPITGQGIDLHYSVGLGVLQHDSGWLRADTIVNGVEWTLEAIRADIGYSLDLLFRRPGFILYQGLNQTYIDFSKWAVYPKKSDQYMLEAQASWDRVLP